MNGLLCEFLAPDLNGTKFLALAVARIVIAALRRSLKLSACLSFRFTVFRKLSVRMFFHLFDYRVNRFVIEGRFLHHVYANF